MGTHQRLNLQSEQTGQIDLAAQITIRDNTGECAVDILHQHTAQTLFGHFDHSLRHISARSHQRHLCALVHNIAHQHQFCAQLAAWMIDLEVPRGKAARLQQSHSQRIAHHQLHGGGGGGGQTIGAGFLGARQNQPVIRFAGQSALRIGGHGDQHQAKTAGEGDHIGEFCRLTRPGQGENGIPLLNHAHITMAGLSRMHKKRRRAC